MILDRITEHKKLEVARRKALAGSAWDLSASDRGLASALRRGEGEPPRIIAEVKKASPSKGIIRPDFDPVAIARSYESAGAAAISVLTDEEFFQGHLDYLTDCREAVSLPVLRKDFTIDEFQIFEARHAGADAVLLIAALLDTGKLTDFRLLAESLGMTALVEVHDEVELESALASGAAVIGINNRNLQTFEVTLDTTFRLAPRIPPGKVIVSESGIATNDDLRLLADAGVYAALVGESLMRAADPGEKLKELTGQ